MDEETYMIKRFYQLESQPTEVIKTGLTLEEAQEHCQNDSSSGDGWFDGFEQE